ncbi:CBL-interacting protein kinase 5 [Phytophthora citrophthora]|uniref:CBL-interacting protein kinase 5 n=1 Tax=Phytophthora citrophthora TaxID=4793 RepID=A0AAD9G1H9_9STRA|nr:CBL-interacting protein kinase 5 [Phytophthora citrophthora]
MWWFGSCAGCSCRLSDVAPTSNWVDLRPLSCPSTSPPVSASGPRPGLYTARNRVTQDLVALKVLDRRLLRDRATRRRLRQEVRVLQLAREHQNLLQLHEVKAVGARVELAFELARGGEVMSRLRSERDASRVLQQAAQGLQFLHERGIIHGEVRPEHLLFSDDEPDARVLLAAFGRAAPWRSLTLRCRPRTRGFLWDDVHCIRFLPPFLLRRKNRLKRTEIAREDDRGHLVMNWREAQQIDIWALGVTLYVMLCGCFPFALGEDNVASIEQHVLEDKLRFPEDGTLLSRAARDLLRRLLEKNPDAGMSIEDVVAHPWLNGGVAPAVSWSSEMMTQHDLFSTRYTEDATAEYRPSGLTSSPPSSQDNQNQVANGPPSAASTLTSFDGPRSSLGAGPVLKRDTLEVEAEEEEARPSFLSTHGNQLLLDEEEQQGRRSADCFMRLASLEMGGNNVDRNSDDEDVVADPGTNSSRDATPVNRFTNGGRQVTREKSLDKMWQVLLRQRRFFSSKSLSSGSSNERS